MTPGMHRKPREASYIYQHFNADQHRPTTPYSDCGSGGRGFESLHPPQFSFNNIQRTERFVGQYRTMRHGAQPVWRGFFLKRPRNRKDTFGPAKPGPGHRNWTGEDVKDFVYLSVYTGLRISDIATFDITKRLDGNDVFLRMHKTNRR